MKIEIEHDDGSKMELKRGSHVYYRTAEGREGFWDWQHFNTRTAEFNPLFEDAKKIFDRFTALIPDIATAPGP